MAEATANIRAARGTGKPRKWGNRRPVAKRLDLTPEDAARREEARLAKLRKDALHIQLTPAEKETIETRAGVYGMRKSDFARTVLLSELKEPPPPRIDPAVARDIGFQISKIGGNLNQFMARTNEAKQIATARQLEVLIAGEKQASAIMDQIAAIFEKMLRL